MQLVRLYQSLYEQFSCELVQDDTVQCDRFDTELFPRGCFKLAITSDQLTVRCRLCGKSIEAVVVGLYVMRGRL